MTGDMELRARRRGRWGEVSADPDDRRFLAGPQSRLRELLWVLRVLVEFIRGFRALHFVGPCVTVFGSARFPEEHRYYERETGGRSIGCNIELPEEQKPNAYLDRWVTFRHFFVRKVMLVKYSYAFIAMPGGFGTLDEVIEAATLVQTRKIAGFPIVLMGVEFWKPLLDFMRGTLIKEGTIDPEDVHFFVTDSPEDAAAHVRHIGLRHFGLTFGPRMKRRWFLAE